MNHYLGNITSLILISKLRRYLSIPQLKQLYYNLIYPYLSYAIIALGSAYKNTLDKAAIQTKYSPKINVFRNYVWTLHRKCSPFLKSPRCPNSK